MDCKDSKCHTNSFLLTGWKVLTNSLQLQQAGTFLIKSETTTKSVQPAEVSKYIYSLKVTSDCLITEWYAVKKLSLILHSTNKILISCNICCVACPEGAQFAPSQNMEDSLVLGENEMSWLEAIEFCDEFPAGYLFYPHSEEERSDYFNFFERMWNERGKNRLRRYIKVIVPYITMLWSSILNTLKNHFKITKMRLWQIFPFIVFIPARKRSTQTVKHIWKNEKWLA